MQGCIHKCGQNRPGLNTGKKVIQYTGNGQGRQQSIKKQENSPRIKNTGKLGNTESVNLKTRNKG